ncbi:hypothetical protein FACS189472_16490 [Alphaproteobacteria bacterium]|nr:hypothetical protein FACS189472_16490 [Alphaproteobacteria bacterium]
MDFFVVSKPGELCSLKNITKDCVRVILVAANNQRIKTNRNKKRNQIGIKI